MEVKNQKIAILVVFCKRLFPLENAERNKKQKAIYSFLNDLRKSARRGSSSLRGWEKTELANNGPFRFRELFHRGGRCWRVAFAIILLFEGFCTSLRSLFWLPTPPTLKIRRLIIFSPPPPLLRREGGPQRKNKASFESAHRRRVLKSAEETILQLKLRNGEELSPPAVL
jgi:hypothetical protein